MCPRNRPWRFLGSEMLRTPHCVGNRLTDGGKLISFRHRQISTLTKYFLFLSLEFILLETRQFQGVEQLEELGISIQFN
jgi:hypothetical protein